MNSFLKRYIQIGFNNNKVSKVVKQLCFFALFIFVGFQAQATHIVGGEMTYRCLGNNKYEIILTVYRDCYYGDPSVGFDDPAWIGFYRNSNNTPVQTIGIQGVLFVPYDATDTLDEQLTSECNIIGQDVCVHRAVYRTVVTLPQIPGGYTVVYQRCCRNETLQNIEVPLNTGAVFSVKIEGPALTSCNSSPRYEDWPPIYVCANKPLNYDHSAIDDDGDELIYTLCNPFESGDTAEGRVYPPPPPPFTEIQWGPGYSLNNLLGGPDPLQINSSTGFITGTPITVGQFLVGVCVTERRNGETLSVIRRDFQYNVRDCSNPTDACFAIPDTLCNTKEIHFKNCSVSTFEYKWTFYDAQGGIFATSTDFEPTITYPDYGTYRVMLISSDGPACVDTMDRNIVISPTSIKAGFSLTVPNCNNDITIKTTNTSAGASNYQWFVIKGGNTVATSNDFQPEFVVTEEGLYNVVLIAYAQNGCSDTIQKSITVKTLGDEIIPNEYTLCLGESVDLNPNGDPNLLYTWTPPTYLTPGPNVPNPTSTPLSSITYFVDVLDPISGCVLRDTVDVKLRTEPNLDFDWTNACGVLVVDFINKTNPPETYFWDFGDGIGTSTDVNPSYTYLTPGSYWVKLSNIGGCERVDSQLIKVNYIDLPSINDSIYLCGTNTTPLNANGNPNYNYVWSPADKILGPNNIPNPIAVIDGYTVFTATVSDPTFNDCTVEARVAVDLAVLNMVSENVFVCEGDNTTLGVTLNGGVGTPTIVWSPDVNIVAGQGTTQITVLGVEDQIYTVTVTYPEPAPEGCTISGSVTLDVGTYGGAVTATIAEVEIFDVEKVQLFAKPDGLQYSWTPTAGLDNPNAQNPIYTPPLGTLGPITFTVTVTQPDGCNRTASVDLTVNPTLCDKDHVFLPNAFSPNGKGDVVNETLRLLQQGQVNKLNKLVIYNRFGQEVFTTTNINFVWDGTFQGKVLDPDVYGFYIDVECIGGAQFKNQGNITIVK